MMMWHCVWWCGRRMYLRVWLPYLPWAQVCVCVCVCVFVRARARWADTCLFKRLYNFFLHILYFLFVFLRVCLLMCLAGRRTFELFFYSCFLFFFTYVSGRPSNEDRISYLVWWNKKKNKETSIYVSFFLFQILRIFFLLCVWKAVERGPHLGDALHGWQLQPQLLW